MGKVIDRLFAERIKDPRWNTSYPLDPKDWSGYRIEGALPFESEKELSFYLHIPFCAQLCSFCEYTRMLCPNEVTQRHYLETVRKDMLLFKSNHCDFVLRGFDIGGGTPTVLSEDNFNLLMTVYEEALDGLTLSDDFEPSIEGSFQTLTDAKLKRIVAVGIRRLSVGVQSTCLGVLQHYHRAAKAVDDIQSLLDRAWIAGIQKVNLDFMYGLSGQTIETIQRDLETICVLQPQQITLYELRVNRLGGKSSFSKETLFNQYCAYYEGLTQLGYVARFGQNTFTKDRQDLGVSSYLRSRMLEGASYKGFGLSAQSMCHAGVSYNIGKNQSLTHGHILRSSYPEGDSYLLPKREWEAKYIAIAAYHGAFSLDRIDMSLLDRQEALRFGLTHGYIFIDEHNRCTVTREGFIYYGALFSLFY